VTGIRNVRIEAGAEPVDLTIRGGVIDSIAPSAGGGFDGRFAFPGFTETHIHLDKAHLLERTAGSGPRLADAVTAVRRAKRGFTESDVYERAERVIRSAIAHGTTLMRTSVEVDPDAGFRSLNALLALRAAYASQIDLRLTAFAQDGTSNTPETVALLEQALHNGADEIGGCSYTDSDPVAHIRAILGLAVDYGVRADFHVDFDLDTGPDHLSLVLDETERLGLQGRVSVGHATRLAVFNDARRAELLGRMTELGVGLVALPATDLYLVGAIAPAAMISAVGTNNVCNPFTPFGDADLLRMANLFATASRLGSDEDLSRVWRMISSGADELLGVRRVIEVGAPATVVVIDADNPTTALRELRHPIAAWFEGHRTIATEVARAPREAV
jgi:cytosine deaminase